ncbi:MAG: sigma-70 family RNA polymerase sigma factor [Thermodesulfobacteriota bacterium]|nr:sigma-70 family RNA polymerase sigma factor [Thermodesulfobacteriota bacterium]
MKSARAETTGLRVKQEPEDQAILERFHAGDGEAVGDLADRYAGRLYSFGLRMCGNSEDAQDMVQDTFLNVIKYLKGFRRETKLRNWLFRLAASACLKKRRGKNDPDRELPLDVLRPSHEKGLLPDIPDWSQSPAEDLLNDELRAYLAKAISKLPPNYRIVFNLRDLEGFSTAETGEMLNLTPQAVKTRLHRARPRFSW